MVPKVAGKGRSFEGAALYYLHDKGALTSGRVAFVLTENLPTDDAEKAIKCMAWTAMHQSEIKARAGGSAKGRRLEYPVYTYSLSWAPDESPDPEEMIAAARESLQALGLNGHETLFVSHNDEPHPHIHVIVNRVHPETGIAAKLSNDHLKLSAWAESYEKRQGKIRCEQRVENNARRREKQFVKDRESQKAAEFHRWRKLRLLEEFQRRQQDQKNLSLAHRMQREFLYRQKEREIRKKAAAFREANKTRWRIVYVDQQDQRNKLLLAQRTAWSRLRYFLQKKAREYFHADRAQRTGFLSGAFAAISGGPRQFADLDKKQRAHRTKLADAIHRQRREAFNQINAAYRADLDKLKAQQGRQRDTLGKQQSEESQQRAREIKQGLDKEEFTRERTAKLLKDAAHKVKNPPGKLLKDFDKTKGQLPPKELSPEEKLHERLKRKIKRKRRQEIEQTKEEITKEKPRPARDFEKASKPPSKGVPLEKATERLKKKIAERRREILKEEIEEITRDKKKRTQNSKTFRMLRQRERERKKDKGPNNGL